jgi:hypothetical protein
MNRVSAPDVPATNCLQIEHLQEHLRSHSIIACYQYITKFAPSRPPSSSPNWIDYGLQEHLQNSIDHGPHVQLSVHSISAAKGISKVARSWPRSVYLSSLNLGLPVYFQNRSITASKCISQFTRSQPPSAAPNSIDHSLQVQLSVHSISATKCISKLGQSQPPSASPNPIDLGLQMQLSVHSISASKFISKFD